MHCRIFCNLADSSRLLASKKKNQEIMISTAKNKTYYMWLFRSRLFGETNETKVISGLLIFRRKKAKFRRIFRGKFAGSRKIGRFRERKVKICRKIKFRRIFRGKFLEKSADFMGNFGGKLRQETISKKQPISLDFFGKFR